MKQIRAIYVEKEAWEKFLKICRREGKFASQTIEDWIKQYNTEHEHGNPQLKMNSYVEGDKEPTPLRVLCNFLEGAMQNGSIYCRKRGGAWVKSIKCYSCPHNRLLRRGKDEVHHRLPDGKLVRCS